MRQHPQPCCDYTGRVCGNSRSFAGLSNLRPKTLRSGSPPLGLPSQPADHTRLYLDKTAYPLRRDVNGYQLQGEWWSGECRCAAEYAAALAHDGPALVDVVVSRPELATPPAVTAEMVKGFTLYMVKAVMSSRGDELLDDARTNLSR
jgi:hypothetical protein